MDSGTIFYIIAVILYFLYTTFKRNKDAKPPEGEGDLQERVPQPERRKQVSFEDLLKEIRNEQNQRQEDLEQPAPKKVPVQKPLVMERKVLQPEPEKYLKPTIEYADGHHGSIIHESTMPLVKLDDRVDLDADDIVLGKVEDVAGIHSSSNRYAELLKDPHTIKDAVVVSEILRPKYF